MNELPSRFSRWKSRIFCTQTFLVQILLLSMFSLPCRADDFKRNNSKQVLGQVGMFNLKYNGFEISGAVIRGSVAMFLGRNISAEAGYSTVSSSNGSAIYRGLDARLKWYLFSQGSDVEIAAENKIINLHSNLKYYIITGYCERLITNANEDIQTNGFSYGAGLSWNLMRALDLSFLRDTYLDLSAFREKLYDAKMRPVDALNILLGFGIIW